MSDVPHAGAVYARILRAAVRGQGVRLSVEECMGIAADDAAVMAALGGDVESDQPPAWLTPRERRRTSQGVSHLSVFESEESPT